MAKARPAEGELGSMTRSVAERVIYEANLGAEDTKIARMYYIERLPQIEIAEEMQVDRIVRLMGHNPVNCTDGYVAQI